MASLRPRAKSRIYAKLEKYARSGMGMEKACQSLLSQPGLGRAERRIYGGLLEGIAAGESIGASLGPAGASAGELEREVISAAEAGGMLERGFAHLATYFERVDETRRRILKGLVYPIVLFHLALVLTVFLSAIITRLRPDGEVQSFGSAFGGAGLLVAQVYLGAILLVVLMSWMRQVARTQPGVDALLNRIPLVGGARKAVARERFCRVFEIFLLSGRRMSDALAGAGQASGSGMIRAASRRGARLVGEGNLLSEAIFAEPRTFPNDFARGIAVGEESGHLDVELRQWGDFYAATAAEAMDALADWAPRIFYWIVLLAVAGLVIRAGLAYRDVIESWLEWEY